MTGNDGAAANFLMTPQADELVEELAAAEHLTIVVGAGASMESGLPSWETLVRDLLEAAARTEDPEYPKERAAEFADWTINRDSLLGAGAVAHAFLGEERFVEELRQALYERVGDPTPGPTALAAARLYVGLGADRADLVTTNYDRLLERAVEDRLAEVDHAAEVSSVVDDRALAPGGLRVCHLHGMLDTDGEPRGRVVLSEADYHRMQDASSWQEEYFAARLKDSAMLFVGTSLSDPNLLRYLYRYRSECAHAGRRYACFARQQDSRLYEKVDHRVRATRERGAGARWSQVGVEPVHLDDFSHTAQLLAEVDHRLTDAQDYAPYRARLIEWHDALTYERFSDETTTFADRQDSLQAMLAGTLETVVQRLHTECRTEPMANERLSASLWLYDPRQHVLVNWVSADRSWRNPHTLQPVKVEWGSPFAAVRAFCDGSLVSESTLDQAATRWNHVVGLPIYLSPTGPWGRLPAGVVTFGSTLTQADSLFGRCERALRGSIGPSIHELVAPILDPWEDLDPRAA